MIAPSSTFHLPVVPSAVVQPPRVLPSKSETQPSSAAADAETSLMRINPTIPALVNIRSRFMDRQPPILAQGRAAESMSITLDQVRLRNVCVGQAFQPGVRLESVIYV